MAITVIDRAKRSLSLRSRVRHFVYISASITITTKRLDHFSRLFSTIFLIPGPSEVYSGFFRFLNFKDRWRPLRFSQCRFFSYVSFWLNRKSNWITNMHKRVEISMFYKLVCSRFFVSLTVFSQNGHKT